MSGVTAAVLSFHNVAQVAYEIMVYQVVHKRITELEEMRKGLEALQLSTLIIIKYYRLFHDVVT